MMLKEIESSEHLLSFGWSNSGFNSSNLQLTSDLQSARLEESQESHKRKRHKSGRTIAAPPKNIRIERRKFFARREAENRRALAVRKVFSDEGLRELYKFYANVFRWSGYNGNIKILKKSIEQRSKVAMTFSQQVYKIVATIPKGKVMSYGQIAYTIGNPRAARQVGWAMRNCPEHLPWQRVVKQDGTIAGGMYADIRRGMLEDEGVPFLMDGRVNMAACSI